MSRCPQCASDGAYIGFFRIECPKRSCKWFTEKAERELFDRAAKNTNKIWDDLCGNSVLDPWGEVTK